MVSPTECTEGKPTEDKAGYPAVVTMAGLSYVHELI
jgi:hypothetical protein